MKKFSKLIVKKKWLILIITLLLMIPNIIGYVKTKINYDILVYLPSDIETLKGEHILTDNFHMGAFSIVVTDNMPSKDVIKLEEEFRKIDSVEHVISINDITGTNIPIEMLPDEIVSKVAKGDSRLILVTFTNSTSDDKTLAAVQEMRDITDDNTKIGGMSAMVLDTKELFNSEMLLYVIIAVILCIVVLELSLDSYFVPILLMLNIGIAILFNMGSNIMFGSISYITKAIAAVLQLGVTTDFSIFLYHKYERLKNEYNDSDKAMEEAIHDTFVSVVGSSLTTIAGFLALCTMKLTLGVDIGLVMAKGVLIGVICVLTVFPALLLIFDKKIEKGKHKVILPKFTKVKEFVLKHYVAIFLVFIVLLIPAYFAQNKTQVYYKLDESIPDNYGYSMATKTLKEDYGMVSQEMILIDKNIKDYEINKMIKEIEKVDGIKKVISSSSLIDYGITENMIPVELKNIYETDKYKMIIIASDYDIATDLLNEQITEVNKIIKKYDDKAILAGEGPLMKDLVNITDIDFKNVNVTSIGVIFVLMMIVLKSISLPVLLVTAIEFAIFINMGVPYFTGTEIPFIASVVIGTIQLGATIDYAILMTTKYLEERSNGLDKKKAVKSALDNSVSSIFVSAMCFFAATIGVGIVSKIDMIGTLCTLIARGAIISMIVVVCIVPSILLIFDKIIMKTTYIKKGKINMKKMKKVLASSLVLSFLLTPVSTLALTKEETVYTKLNSDGTVKSTTVNEHLINSDKKDTLEDITDLENIVNINSDNKFDINSKRVTWSAFGSDIFYQGTTKKELPVTEAISYKLNGKDISIDDLIGKKGNVEISIRYTNNVLNYVTVNGKSEALYTPFIVATVTNLSSNNNSNVTVTNGKVIDTGIAYQIVALSTPGLYESLRLDKLEGLDTVTIKFDTTKFELSSIYSVITPKVIDSSDLKILDKLEDAYSKINTLQSSMNQIENGSKELKDGSKRLKDGLSEAINKLNSSGTENTLNDEQLSSIETQTVNTVDSMFTDEYKNEIADTAWTEVRDNMDPNDANVVNKVKSAVTKAVVEYLVSVNKYNDYVNCETGKAIVAQGGEMTVEQQTSCGVILADTVLPVIQTAATTAASDTASNISVYVAENVSKGVSVTVAEKTAKKTAGDLSKRVANDVANEVKGAVLTNVKDSLDTLYQGVDKLDSGVNTLSDGISRFNKEGINTLSNMTTDVKQLSGKVEALVKLSNEYQSFSEKDANTKSNTKFIMVVDSKKEEKKEVKKEETKKKESFWDRLVNLFK